MSEQKPSIGRIVHYQARGSADGKFLPEPRAAIVTQVHGTEAAAPGEGARVGLAVLNPSGLFFDQSVPYAETPTPGCWSWPPRS